jgi:hypothetical protein
MKVLIVHFRSAPGRDWKPSSQHGDSSAGDSAGTDGVSLEMVKRRNLLEAMGHKVAICSAYDWAEYPLPSLEFDSDETRRMMRNLFEQMSDYPSEHGLENAFQRSCAELRREFDDMIEDFSPDMLFVHNVLCLPIHPAATVALTELVGDIKLPCAAIHHDILSEGAYKFKPTCDFAGSILEGYYPPLMENIRHWTINSRNQKALKDKGVDAGVIHDSMDFDERLAPESYRKLRAELRGRHGIRAGDITLFVGARIVPNKRIEIAGQLTAAVNNSRDELVGKKLYHGDTFTDQRRVVLVLAGRPEAAFVDYKKELFELFDRLRIDWMYVGDEVRPFRSEEEGVYALYPDMYAMADFILYPTGWEGFGNQLLEAFAAHLPVAVFEYPVFKEDIAPKGVKVVSLGDTVEQGDSGLYRLPQGTADRASCEISAVLTSSERYNDVIDTNVRVGRRHFSFDVLREHLKQALTWAESVKPE